MKKLRNTRSQVETMLEVSTSARNSDNVLIALIWRDECQEKGITNLESFFSSFNKGELTSPESIRRVRQKVQEEGLYPPTEKVGKRRDIRKEDIRTNINNKTLWD